MAVFIFIVEPTCGEGDIVVTASVRCLFVPVLCLRPDLSGP